MKYVIAPVLVAAVLAVSRGEAQPTESGSAGTVGAPLAAPGAFEGYQSIDASGFTGVTLPPGHWAVEAMERGEVLLLIPAGHSAQRALPLELVEAGLREAVTTAQARNRALLSLAEGWYRRLLEEFPGLVVFDDSARWRLLEHRAGIGLALSEGAAAPGLGEFEPDRTGALEVEDRRAPVASANLAAAWSDHVSVAAGFDADSDAIRLRRAEVAVGLRRWRASAGRVEVGYGYGYGGGIALTGAAPLDAVQIGTRQALDLPGVLGPLGRTAFHTFLGRLDEDRHRDTPYFWGASLRIQPSRRISLAVNRAAMFGGDEAITTGRIASMLIGRVKGIGFENQIVTASGRVVLPTERVVPLVVHLEWGAEDAAGSWWSVPGIVGGVSIPGIPVIPRLALTAEYAHFGTSCCGNPSWYRHWSFHGGWASGDRTLGHPLGGNGSQVMVSGTLDLADGTLKGSIYQRDRGAENLFAPERLGISRGLESSFAWNPMDGWHLRIEAGHETGASWSESRIRLGIERF